MIAIDAVVRVEPERRLSVTDDHALLGLSPARARVYGRLYGYDRIPVAAAGQEFPMLLDAVARLLDEARVTPERVAVVVHAHTGPYIGPVGAGLPRLVARQLGGEPLCFGTQSNKCVSSITALDLMDRLLAGRPGDAVGVLLIGETADSPDLRVLDTGIAGDVACAVLLRRDGPRDRVLAHAVATHGRYAGGIYTEPGAPSRQEYERRFQEHLGDVVDRTLRRAGRRPDELTVLLPHNVNVNVWRAAAGVIGVPAERIVLDNVPRYGHCFGADIFLNLDTVRPRLRPGDLALMASVGVGGTFGAVLLEH
ncbi:3-oxoacyl-[acyl-carrier-protein] synthase III C-terminal domain-containing protein [Micromonospora sp. CA-248089]|uniref:3-oxoacyl-[acyl-carrier-protein] synthase III C-terminal domain-containing protein n=1 Tax=Micromonospora sp. CA-248089 TaxID=3239960 RepID=UPI003D922F01